MKKIVAVLYFLLSISFLAHHQISLVKDIHTINNPTASSTSTPVSLNGKLLTAPSSGLGAELWIRDAAANVPDGYNQ